MPPDALPSPAPRRSRFAALVAPYRGLHRNIWLIVLGWLIANLGSSIAALFFNFYLTALGFDQAFIGDFNAVPALVVVFLGVPAGVLSDRIGHRFAMRLGLIIAIVGFWGIVFSDTKSALLLWNALAGAGTAFIIATSGPLLTANTTGPQRAAAFSLQSVTWSITYMIGNSLGGPLPRLLGGLVGASPDAVVSLRMTLAVAAGFISLALVPLFLLRPAPAHLDDAHPHHPAPADGAAPAARIAPGNTARLFFWLLFPSFIIAFGAGPIIPFLNLYLDAKFALPFEGIGLVFAFSSVVTTVGVLLQPHLATHVGKIRSVVIVQAASIPFLLALGFAPWFWVVAAAMGLRAALMNMGNPIYQAFCMEHVPPRMRATFAGLLEATWSVGWAVGAAGSGRVRDALGVLPGFNVLFALMVAFYLASIAVLWFVWDRERNSSGRGESLTEVRGISAPSEE